MELKDLFKTEIEQVVFSDGMIRLDGDKLGEIQKECQENDKFVYAICDRADIGKSEDTDYLNKLVEPERERQRLQIQEKAAAFKQSAHEAVVEISKKPGVEVGFHPSV